MNLDVDINIDKMNIEELREFSRNLIKLVQIDNELIQSMRNFIDLIKTNKENN